MRRRRSHKRKRRGVASILGILLMVGILITSILPTFLYVNEVNNYYDRTVVDLKISDNERSLENLEVNGYGHNDSSIDVFIINRSPLAVNITRIWVLRVDLKYSFIYDSGNRVDLPEQMTAGEQMTMTFDLTDILNNNTLQRFLIEVSTERGNKFSSQTNPLYYDEGDWQTGSMEFNIQTIVLSDQGQDRYFIEIKGLNGTHYDWVDSATIQGQFFCVFSCPEAGEYNVTVTNIKGSDYEVGNKTVVLSWIYPTAFCQFDDRGGH
jgi:hypothetical protein